MPAKILLVDDEADVRRALAILLFSKDYRVVEARDGAEALNLCHQHDFSLIILDHNMPNMTGLQVLRELRNKLGREGPILMMSGRKDKQIQNECYSLGVYDFINKPEQNEVILSRVANGLQIAELIQFKQRMQNDLLFSAAILNNLASERTLQKPEIFVSVLYEPYAAIGGDVFLILDGNSDMPIFVVADITGHGVSAALFSIFVRTAAQRAGLEHKARESILNRLNEEFTASFPSGHFVTMFCCAINVKTKSLVYCNAGHPSPLICQNGKVAVLSGGQNPFLGVSRHAHFHSNQIFFMPGDRMLIFTDGVVELEREAKYYYDSGLENFACDSRMHEDVFQAIQEYFEQQTGVADDRTLMLISAK